MQVRNRIHGTRWPLSAKKRLEIAEIDLEFVGAMHRIGFDRNENQVLNRIAIIAGLQWQRAQAEIKN